MKYDKINLDDIVNIMVPGVWGFINEARKEVFISYSKCVLEGVVRQYKNTPKKWVGWEPIIIVTASGKKDLCGVYRRFEEKGYKIISRKINYKVVGRIEQDYRSNNPPYRYLYYVWLCTKNYKIEPLGVFGSVAEGEEFIKKMAGYIPADNLLTTEYRESWKEEEYLEKFKNVWGLL